MRRTDNITDRLAELLADDNGIEKIKAMADSLLGSGTAAAPTEKKDPSDGFSLPDNFDISKIMGLMSAIGGRQSDHRADLLLALKPHLSQARRERVDKAVRLIKLASLIPILKEQGLLDIL